MKATRKQNILQRPDLNPAGPAEGRKAREQAATEAGWTEGVAKHPQVENEEFL